MTDLSFLSLDNAARVAECRNDLLVVHVHIPKTGGSSLSNVMRNCAGKKGKRFAYGHLDDFLAMTPTEQRRVIAIDAHMGYGIHLQPGFPSYRANCTFYVTSARSYVDIIWSSFGHRMKINATEDMIKPDYWDLISGGLVSRMICCWSDPQHDDYWYDSNGHIIKTRVPPRSPRPPFPNSPTDREAILRWAVRRACNGFSLVGSIDNFDTFSARVATIMGCRGDTTVHINKSEQKKESQAARLVHPLDVYLNQTGVSEDMTLMKLLSLVARGDRSVCQV